MNVALISVAVSSPEIRKLRAFADMSTRRLNSAICSAVAGTLSSISGRMSTPLGVASA